MPILPTYNKADLATIAPAGDYLMHIVKSELKETKNKKEGLTDSGEYLALTYKILESPNGKHVGMMVFNNLNIINDNEVAVRIALSALEDIKVATGQLEAEDSSDLHQKPMVVTLTVSEATAQYPASNNVGKHKPASEWDSVAKKEGITGTIKKKGTMDKAKQKELPWEPKG